MDDRTNEESALNPTVIKLGLVSLFADISSEMLYPITPIFLTTVLGASMASVGLVEGCAEATASLLKTPLGAWSDRLGRRRPFLCAGYFLTAVSKPIIGIAAAWPEVLLARSLDRAGKGLRGGPRDAMIADAVAPHLRGAAFGWHRAMDTIGAAIGPLIAVLYLHYYSDQLRGIFLWALIPGLIAFALTFSVRDRVKPTARTQNNLKLFNSWCAMSVPFRRYLLTWGLFSLANSSDVFLLLKAKGAGLSLTNTIFIYCFYNLIYALASPSLGGLSDRIGRKPLLLAGLLTFAAVYGGFALASSWWQFSFLFGIYGLYMAATDGVGKAFAIDLVEPSQRALGVGMLGTVTGLATLVASASAGLLWDHWGASTAFIFAAIGACVAALSLVLIRPIPGAQGGGRQI